VQKRHARFLSFLKKLHSLRHHNVRCINHMNYSTTERLVGTPLELFYEQRGSFLKNLLMTSQRNFENIKSKI